MSAWNNSKFQNEIVYAVAKIKVNELLGARRLGQKSV